MSTQALDVLQPQDREIKLWRQPEMVIAEAQQAAKALQEVLRGKKNPVVFNKEQYLEYEDWQLLGQFFRYCVAVESTEYVEFGSVAGFKATAVLKNEDTQEVISRAESMCLNNEDNWGMVTEYEWKDVLDGNGKKQWDPLLFGGKGGYIREKVKGGEKAKPLFQIMSMAQTRACAKAYRNKLSWVVVLAGYKPTPAEELDHHSTDEQYEPPKATRGKRAVQSTSQPAQREKVICADCRGTDSHALTCKHHPKNVSTGGQPVQGEVVAKEAKKEADVPKALKQETVVVKSCSKKVSRKKTNYLELVVKDDQEQEVFRYVWHGHLQKEPSDLSTTVGKMCIWDVAESVVSGKQLFEVKAIHQIGTQVFVDDKPVDAPSSAEVGFENDPEQW